MFPTDLLKSYTVSPTVAWLTLAICCCAALDRTYASASIRGTVVGENGQPVADARVDVSIAVPISGPAIFCPSCYLDCQKWTTTDRAGRFEIIDLDARLQFRLVISAAGYKTAQTELIAPAEKPHQLTLRERPRTADYQHTVQGLVVNESGIAVQGALVSPVYTIDTDGLRSSSSNGVSPAVTDAKGHFEIDLVDGVSGIDIEISAEGLCDRRFVGLTPSDSLKTYDLLEGGRVVGSVYSMGSPVSGMTISVAQTDHSYDGTRFFQRALPTVTDTRGRFEFKNLLPDQEYCVYSVRGEANRANSVAIIKTEKFMSPSSGKVFDVGELATVPPVTFGGRLVAGESVSFENLFLLLIREPAWDNIKIPVSRDGSFHLDGLPPEVYEIALSSSEYELDGDKVSGLLWMKNSIKRLLDKDQLDFQLPIQPIDRTVPDLPPNGQQTLSGRVVLTDDKAAARIRINASDSVEALGKGLGSGTAPWTNASASGQFTLAELPDTRVWLKLYRPDADGMRFWYLGMIKPKLNDHDITIRLGPETSYELNMRKRR